MVAGGDLPGREIPKEYRDVALELVNRQGWRYNAARHRGGHPALYPADRTQRPIAVPTTPSSRRALRNWIAQIRRAGGQWPPESE